MFKLDPDPKFWTTAKVRLPGEPTQEFRVQFRVAPVAQVRQMDWRDAVQVDGFLRDHIHGLDEIADAGGKPLTLDLLETVERLLDLPHVRTALVIAYTDGLNQAREGN